MAAKQPTMPLMSRFCTSTTPPGIGTNISDRMNAPLVRKCCHELGCSVRARYSTARSSLPQMPGQTMSRMTRFTARYGSVQATHRRANLSPGAQLLHQRHRAVHQPERQHQKQRLVDKKTPVCASHSGRTACPFPASGRTTAPQPPALPPFAFLQVFSFLLLQVSASKPALLAGASAARYSSGVPNGRCKSHAKPAILAPCAASTL